jgi:Spy/CpxP family protein refolding chaperone
MIEESLAAIDGGFGNWTRAWGGALTLQRMPLVTDCNPRPRAQRPVAIALGEARNDVGQCDPNDTSQPFFVSTQGEAGEYRTSIEEGLRTMNHRLNSRLAAIAASALVLLTGAAALAQPGPHHGGDFTLAIAALKGQLNLNTSQQTMWDSAVAQSKAARDTARANMDKVKTAMTTELAKAEPDLSAVAAVSDDVQASNSALRKQVRGTWLALYATLTPDQKAIVKTSLQNRMAKMESFRQKMLERRGG